MKHHPDRNPGNPEAEAHLQGSQRGLRGPVRARTSARPTIASGMPVCRATKARAAGSAAARRVQRHLRRRVRRHLRRRAPRRPQPGVSRRRPALRARADARASRRRRLGQSRAPDASRVHALRRQRRRARHAADHAARPAAARARFASRRDSSRSSRPARAAAAPARSIDKPCRDCSGRGRVRKIKTLVRESAAPASTTATASGWRARARPGATAGPPGDLYVDISVQATTRSSRAKART